MDERAQGIVLRVHRLTETSLIVRWLTREFGRIATVAKGARRTKSPFRGKLDLFYLADFSFSRSRRSDLHTLREVTLIETNVRLRRELGSLQQASYCATLIEQVTEVETPIPAISSLMKSVLSYLSNQPALQQTVFAFELKLLSELGLEPDLTRSRLTAKAKEIVGLLRKCDWNETGTLKMADELIELQQFLHGFLIYHLGKIPPNRTAALCV